MENKNVREREEIHKAIWSIADELRESVDGTIHIRNDVL